MAAAAAHNEATQAKSVIRLVAKGSDRHRGAVEPLLNAGEGLEADERLMLTGQPIDVPFGYCDEPGIHHLIQDAGDALRVDLTLAVFGEKGVSLQETLHICLCLEEAGGKSFQRFPDDARKRLIGNEDFSAMASDARVAIADGRAKAPISITHTRLHSIFGLLCIFLTLVLRDGGQKIFNEHAVRIFAELDGRRLKFSP